MPRQRRNMEALQLISDTLDVLIAKCKKLVRLGVPQVGKLASHASPGLPGWPACVW